MPPTRPARSAATVPAAALVLLLASGLTGCGDDRTTGEPIPPVLMTDTDGVVRGPEPGAEPVEPPGPARAGDLHAETETEAETRREQEPAPADADTPEPPPPPPPAEDDDPAEPDDADHADDADEADEADEADDDSDDDDD